MTALYQLTQDFIQLDELLELAQTEEEKATAEEIQEIIKKAIEDKSNDIAFYIKNMESDIEAIKNEEKRLKEMRQARENKLKNLKQYVVTNLIILGRKSFSTVIGKVSIRTSKAVQVNTDINTLPDEFKRVKTVVEPDKTALKKALTDGKEIDGVELVENYSLNIR